MAEGKSIVELLKVHKDGTTIIKLHKDVEKFQENEARDGSISISLYLLTACSEKK